MSEEKDLGVVVSNDLKWEQQCSQTVAKANKVLGLIKRNFTDRSKETIILLFKSLVRPHVEYCCPIWNPHYIMVTRGYANSTRGLVNSQIL